MDFGSQEKLGTNGRGPRPWQSTSQCSLNRVLYGSRHPGSDDDLPANGRFVRLAETDLPKRAMRFLAEKLRLVQQSQILALESQDVLCRHVQHFEVVIRVTENDFVGHVPFDFLFFFFFLGIQFSAAFHERRFI